VAGDTLVDRGQGLEFLPEWAPDGVAPEAILEALQPLRELPVELVLPTHGPPTDRAALERALDA
jgi:glyoxylase-like metal-dependent hydrolase (beta-lactamase superfamily II)